MKMLRLHSESRKIMRTNRWDTRESELLVQIRTRLVILLALGPEAFKIVLVKVRVTWQILYPEELVVPVSPMAVTSEASCMCSGRSRRTALLCGSSLEAVKVKSESLNSECVFISCIGGNSPGIDLLLLGRTACCGVAEAFLNSYAGS